MKTRNNFIAVVMLTTLIFVLASLNVKAQEEESTATLEETLSFIKNSMEVWGNGNDAKAQFLPIKGCKVQIVLTYTKTKKYVWTQTFSLSDLDPLTIEPLYSRKINEQDLYMKTPIGFHTTNNKPLINLKIKDEEGLMIKDEMQVGGGIDIYANDEKQTQSKRIVRALRHAVKLCGGKVDPF